MNASGTVIRYILLIALALIFIVSIVRVIKAKGRTGGYGAGISAGLVCAAFKDEIFESFRAILSNWPGIVKVLVIGGLYVGLFALCAFLLTKGQEWGENTELSGPFVVLGAVFRIIAAFGFAFIGFSLLFSIGNGGMVFY